MLDKKPPHKGAEAHAHAAESREWGRRPIARAKEMSSESNEEPTGLPSGGAKETHMPGKITPLDDGPQPVCEVVCRDAGGQGGRQSNLQRSNEFAWALQGSRKRKLPWASRRSKDRIRRRRASHHESAAVPGIRDPGALRGIGNGVMGVVMWIVGRHANA